MASHGVALAAIPSPFPPPLPPTPKEHYRLSRSVKKSKREGAASLTEIEDTHIKEIYGIDEQPTVQENWATKLFSKDDEEPKEDPILDIYIRDNEDEEEDNEWFQDEMEGDELMES